MDDLEELLDRLTIKFPEPLKFGEIEGRLFEYLKSEAQCTINYDLFIKGYKSPGEKSERYPTEIKGSIFRRIGDEMASSTFTMTRDSKDCFVDLKIQTVLGYDSIDEFETMPSGKEQLRLADDLRKTLESYFSQRHKRPK